MLTYEIVQNQPNSTNEIQQIEFRIPFPAILVDNKRVHNRSGPKAGCADRVRKLAVDGAAIGSTLVKSEGVLAEEVRSVVGDDPYKVRAVRVAEMAHTVAKRRMRERVPMRTDILRGTMRR